MRATRSLLLILGAILCLAMCTGTGHAESRVALVIGNGAYENVGALENPGHDAAAVAKALRDVGFQTVQAESDLGHDAMLAALHRFESAANDADWALVYYAGHGIEVGGVNYLIPVDARIRSDRDVDEEAISLAQVQKRLEGARKLRIVILDACRDNPFLAKMQRTHASSRSVGRGLAVPNLPETGSLVAFSAAAGQVALDGETGSGNSPYAAAIVKNLAVPDVEVNLFFRRVRVAVLRETGNNQEPATYESLPDDRLIFRPSQPSAPAAPVSGPSAVRVPIAPGARPAPERRALVSECDRLASAPGDPGRPRNIDGVAQTAVDAGMAIPACRAAVAGLDDPSTREGPEGQRMLFQLGRALAIGGEYSEAKKLYEQAATFGYASAMNNLGRLYSQGKGVVKDDAVARSWFEKGAARGEVTAMQNLAYAYLVGKGVTKDYATARGWYEKAAAGGEIHAMITLGILYEKGEGVERDYWTARIWYEKAAAVGEADAMSYVGNFYNEGKGVSQNYPAARTWYERGAAAGNTASMNSLGGMYWNGHGVGQDYAAARAWYAKSAAAGNATAMLNLGKLYENGLGVSLDYKAARGWYEKAVTAGYKDAVSDLDRVRKKGG